MPVIAIGTKEWLRPIVVNGRAVLGELADRVRLIRAAFKLRLRTSSSDAENELHVGLEGFDGRGDLPKSGRVPIQRSTSLCSSVAHRLPLLEFLP